ncbi:N-acylethanolamine amidohydrolase [Diaporthe helianthi]|uniref:N-acylethanolamine amidohydrolase n=1 Tax=Diaporthe helianthi TaxID=158607 RepID=A0A2P5HIZ4_DIAHE|nr:N-acylethanolamine amidohydrolase [Diaporthe helianthi]
MTSTQRFADYPPAQEASYISYKTEEDNNPALRGMPLAIGAAIVTRSQAIQRFLYGNAGFSKLTSIDGLSSHRWRFDPTVIPLADPGAPAGTPTFEDELLRPQDAGRPGRWSSFADYHALYQAGKVTPLQVVEALLPVIDRTRRDRTEYSTAWLDIHTDEVLAAARASTDRWAAGKPLSVLDGVPFGVKADCEVKGYVNTMGMAVRPEYDYFNKPAAESIWPVRKLEELGAIMVGKMNQHEIGMDTTGCNAAQGTPTNWYNKAYYPGGSSSGAGSSLGAGLVPLCIGTDAGGSIRIPPAIAGQYSLKTSHSRTMVMNSSMCIVGPMASNVADLTIAYRVIAQPNPADPVQGLFAPSRPPPKGEKKLLGLCYPWIARATPQVREYFDRALDYFTTRLGYETVDIDIPFLREGQVAHGATCLAEAADHAKDRVPPGNAKGQHWMDLLGPANQIMTAVGSQTTANDYMKFAQVRATIMSHLAHLFERHGSRLLIASPMMPDVGYAATPGDERYGFTDGNRALRSMTYAWLANTSGCPAATVPVGYADVDKGWGKLPVGMLAMGMWGEEERLLGWAADGERYIRDVYPGGRLRPEGWVDVIGLARDGKGEGAAV